MTTRRIVAAILLALPCTLAAPACSEAPAGPSSASPSADATNAADVDPPSDPETTDEAPQELSADLTSSVDDSAVACQSVDGEVDSQLDPMSFERRLLEYNICALLLGPKKIAVRAREAFCRSSQVCPHVLESCWRNRFASNAGWQGWCRNTYFGTI